MSSLKSRIDIQEFIISYLTTDVEVSCVNTDFHDAFWEAFGGKRSLKLWGAQPVHKAMTALKSLCDQGILERKLIPLGLNWQPGFPHWAYCYSLKEG